MYYSDVTELNFKNKKKTCLIIIDYIIENIVKWKKLKLVGYSVKLLIKFYYGSKTLWRNDSVR